MVSGAFSDYIHLTPGETVKIDGITPEGRKLLIIVDGRRHFALRFSFNLRSNPGDLLLYSDGDAVFDKNPKTCADDNIYDAVVSLKDYFTKHSK